MFPFQQAGVKVLTALPALLLADDMGLGKTVQAIAAIDQLHRAGDLERVLVVAPAGLLAHWRRSFQQFGPALTAIRVMGPPGERAWQWQSDHTVHIVSYETLRSDRAVARARRWDLVALDEAQRIKNRDTAVSRACKRLPRLRAWALTGTPLENRVDDLASVLEFVRPNPEGISLPSLGPGMQLLMKHQELQLRRRKAEVLTELPPRLDIRLEVELSSAQRRAYQDLLERGRRKIAGLGQEATVINVLELIIRLKQVCNFDPETGSSAKLENLSGQLGELTEAGHRALIFSQFVSSQHGVERIAQGLERFRPLTYTGALGFDEREQVIRRFRDDSRHRALVLSLRAGGNGLNLQTASYVFHFDRWWNPAVENQASDRSHRLGQANAVTVYAYVSADTIEERIEQILDQKRALFASLVDRVSLDPARLLTPEEIFGLVGLEAPSRLKTKSQPATDPVGSLAWHLREWGWRVEAGSTGPDGPVLRARRDDEVGLEEVVWVYAVDGSSPEMLDDIQTRVPPGVRVKLLPRATNGDTSA